MEVVHLVPMASAFLLVYVNALMDGLDHSVLQVIYSNLEVGLDHSVLQVICSNLEVGILCLCKCFIPRDYNTCVLAKGTQSLVCSP